MEEQWKTIIIEQNSVSYDFTGKYEVSNHGRVKSLNYRGHGEIRILKPRSDKNGYLTVALCKDGKVTAFKIHRLVSTAFIPNPDNLPVVNHIDEDKTNNHVENLEWCTQKYNNDYGTRVKRAANSRKGKYTGENSSWYGRHHTEETKRKISEAKKGKQTTLVGSKHPQARKVICIETKKIFDCIKEAQEWLGKGNIKTCIKGRTKTAGGYHWKYYNDYLIEKLIVN